MESSSSSTPSSRPPKKDDVFISFRGEETSHLQDALRRDQIETYIDCRLEKGDKELTKILECSKNQGHLVMPVFYRVDPSDVRKLFGSYQKAFDEHDHKSISKQQLQKWRKALTYASNLAGWHCSFDRNLQSTVSSSSSNQPYRTGFHFQPSKNWINDPNGQFRKYMNMTADFERCLVKMFDETLKFAISNKMNIRKLAMIVVASKCKNS
ncbi:disease resistance protein RPV1-like [Prosopis cineraria]|uniref:disease resistance protein RPV1-like n=1 Tax=Prosopis cineraria TaxID=364024 RepID=UPI00240EE98F|nr:disease resistance protein RPV1-like [Prosopis cineraria]